MRTYRLKLAEDGRRNAKDVEFEAEDFAVALWVAQKQALGRSAQLWCDGTLLHSIGATPNQLVQVEQVQTRTEHYSDLGTEEAARALQTLRPQLRLRSSGGTRRSDASAC